ncbi:MAG: hypothetical protein HC922_07190 [Leptolyngbyaceae cyanobacterium SM2_3_12]|nr:hypothetical protein [Leptolyngbyaceae cyanobacterium SM2_3_12]
MSNPNGVTPFADNWAYLKTELSWLDRLLMVAVSRQKRELQDLDDFANSSEDRVTSHWWKGIIAINGQPGYDHARPPKAPANKGAGYTQPARGANSGQPAAGDRSGPTLAAGSAAAEFI